MNTYLYAKSVIFSLLLMTAYEASAQTCPKQSGRTYEDISRDFEKQAQSGMDTLYNQVGKAVQVAQQVADKIDMSEATNGKIVVQNDTIDFGTPAAKLYETLKGLIPSLSEPSK